MAKQWTGSISTNTNTPVSGLTVGLNYGVKIYYPSGVTGTVTLSELAPDGTTYSPVTNASGAVSITASGTDTGIKFQCTSSDLRITTASLSGGSVHYKVFEIPHGH